MIQQVADIYTLLYYLDTNLIDFHLTHDQVIFKFIFYGVCIMERFVADYIIVFDSLHVQANIVPQGDNLKLTALNIGNSHTSKSSARVTCLDSVIRPSN